LFGFTSLGVVLISTVTFIMQTFPEFQLDDENDAPFKVNAGRNNTVVEDDNVNDSFKNTGDKIFVRPLYK
jgi:hypothetical protein